MHTVLHTVTLTNMCTSTPMVIPMEQLKIMIMNTSVIMEPIITSIHDSGPIPLVH